MPYIARVVSPEGPHHVVQRGNRRQRVFFEDSDRRFFLGLLRDLSRSRGVRIWAYCLMDNHVHLVAVPQSQEALSDMMGDVAWAYSRHVNYRQQWRGRLWQGPFFSCPLANGHLLATMRYVERNPVRAGMVSKAEDYAWSSAKAHVYGTEDSRLSPNPVSDEVPDWREFLRAEDDARVLKALRLHTATGRPLGNRAFVTQLESVTGRALAPRKRGPKAKMYHLPAPPT